MSGPDKEPSAAEKFIDYHLDTRGNRSGIQKQIEAEERASQERARQEAEAFRQRNAQESADRQTALRERGTAFEARMADNPQWKALRERIARDWDSNTTTVFTPNANDVLGSYANKDAVLSQLLGPKDHSVVIDRKMDSVANYLAYNPDTKELTFRNPADANKEMAINGTHSKMTLQEYVTLIKAEGGPALAELTSETVRAQQKRAEKAASMGTEQNVPVAYSPTGQQESFRPSLIAAAMPVVNSTGRES